MNTFSHNDGLFTASGCLSPEALEKYANKKLSSTETNLVEKHIAGCPFCKDAVEGAQHVTHFAAHSRLINDRLRSRFRYIPGKGGRRNPVLGNFLLPAAASVIVLVGIIAWFQYFYPEKQELAVVMDTIPVQAEEIEVTEKSEANSIPESPEESTAIGGVFSREENDPGTQAKAETEALEEITAEKPVTLVAAEDDAQIEEADLDEVYAVKPENADAKADGAAMEEKRGGGQTELNGALEKKSTAEVRQKESQKTRLLTAEQLPEYPGGKDSLQSFLINNLTFPKDVEHKSDTTVVVSFLVNKRGKIKDISIIKSAGKAFDEEVIRVIRLMPDWIPAEDRGKPIAVKYNLPVHFEGE